MKHLSCIAILLAACASFASTPAQATTNTISWVSSTGSGSTCSRTSPCGNFIAAMTATDPGGYIHCVDAGFYGDITPTKNITVDCKGTGAVSSSLTLNSGGFTVVVRGITFDTFSTGSAVYSVGHNTIVIEDCSATSYPVPSGSSGNAVWVRPTSPGTTKITINNFVGAGMGNSGIYIDSTGSPGQIQVSVSNSVFASNGGSGIATNASAAAEIRLMLDGVKISGNGIGVNSNGPSSNVIIGRSVVTENQVGFATSGGGKIYSYGTNKINGNNNDNVNVSTLISQN